MEKSLRDAQILAFFPLYIHIQTYVHEFHVVAKYFLMLQLTVSRIHKRTPPNKKELPYTPFNFARPSSLIEKIPGNFINARSLYVWRSRKINETACYISSLTHSLRHPPIKYSALGGCKNTYSDITSVYYIYTKTKGVCAPNAYQCVPPRARALIYIATLPAPK